MAFWGCAFCGGHGCLACDKQAEKAYAKAFPDGPKPILVIKAEYQDDLGAMQDDGCPNVPNDPFKFSPPSGDTALDALLRKVIEEVNQR